MDGIPGLPDNSIIMRNFLMAILIVSTSLISANCQQQLDGASKEDVEQLLEVTGARQRVVQLWSNMVQQSATTAADSYRLKHPDATPLELRKVAEITGEHMQTVFKTFSVDELLDAIVPVYQRHFTHADIQNIVSFYTSGPGQRWIKEMPTMMAESMQVIDPIIKKHLPELQAAADKEIEQLTKSGVEENSNTATPQ